MMQELRASLMLLILFVSLAGAGYPLLMRAMGQTLFSHQANGSLIKRGERTIGSELIGQKFVEDIYFHPRPSAAGSGYDASISAGSDLSPTSADLLRTIAARVSEIREDGNARPIPIDLVTASGSGLDPDISVAAARFQAERIAYARSLPQTKIDALIDGKIKPRSLGVWGESRINVLDLNMELNALQASGNQ